MKKLIFMITIIVSGYMANTQSHTYNNNYGAIYQEGHTSDFTEFPMRWIISNAGNGSYNINYSICLCGQCSLEVKYSHFDKSKKMHIYIPDGLQYFEGDTVKHVTSSGRLSDYAKGIAPDDMNSLGIIFTDNSGIIYKLSNADNELTQSNSNTTTGQETRL